MVRRHRRTYGDRVLILCINVLMAVCSFIFLYPMWQTLVLSFSPAAYADSLGFKFWPKQFSLEPMRYVFSSSSIYIGYQNTLIRTGVGTFLSVFVTYCGAYTLSRRDLPCKAPITFLIIFTMFFSGGLIPSYLNMRNLGLIGSRWALILPGLTSAWNLVIARNFIASLPSELEEAAMVDGAHPLRIVFQILLPLSKPILAVLSLWIAVGHWNAWFDAMLYNNEAHLQVLQLVVRRMVMETANDAESYALRAADVASSSVKAATIVVSVFPILCLYPFLQKHFVKGVMVGALKG
ncbi:MAG: carbohydrate ABC transporter permease [Clostridia bacterium]